MGENSYGYLESEIWFGGRGKWKSTLKDNNVYLLYSSWFVYLWHVDVILGRVSTGTSYINALVQVDFLITLKKKKCTFPIVFVFIKLLLRIPYE